MVQRCLRAGYGRRVTTTGKRELVRPRHGQCFLILAVKSWRVLQSRVANQATALCGYAQGGFRATPHRNWRCQGTVYGRSRAEVGFYAEWMTPRAARLR